MVYYYVQAEFSSIEGTFIIEFRAEFSSIEGTINNHELTLGLQGIMPRCCCILDEKLCVCRVQGLE